MQIQSGTRAVTQFKIKINIADREKWVSVPVTDYHAISQNETVIIDCYSGAFNFPYLKYHGKP